MSETTDNDDTEEKAREAFDADLCSYHDELFRHLKSRLDDRDAASDLVQETCIRALRYRDRLDGDPLRPLLYRIANNLLVDHWRRNQRHHEDQHIPLTEAEPIAADLRAPEDALADAQRLAALKRAIRALPPKRRRVFVLVRLHGKSYAEVARRCGISVGAVEKHVARAVVFCGERLRRKPL